MWSESIQKSKPFLHVKTVIGKINKTCGILNKLKYHLPQSILLNIYNTLILPYLQYCAIVWASCNHSKSLIRSLLYKNVLLEIYVN